MTEAVGILGGGPWGLALALAASRTGASVTLHMWWSSDASVSGVRVTTDLAELGRAKLFGVVVFF